MCSSEAVSEELNISLRNVHLSSKFFYTNDDDGDDGDDDNHHDNSVQFGSLYYGTESTARWPLTETAQHRSTNYSIQFSSSCVNVLV